MSEQNPDRTPVIVVGVDGSAAGKAALHWAMTEATRQHGVVRAVSVRYPSEWAPATSMAVLPYGSTHPEVDPEQHKQWLLKQINEARAGIAEAPTVVAVPLVGDPTRELTRESATADLLVVGSHGRSLLADVFLGSVAASTLRHAKCPVAVIPQRVPEPSV